MLLGDRAQETFVAEFRDASRIDLAADIWIVPWAETKALRLSTKKAENTEKNMQRRE